MEENKKRGIPLVALVIIVILIIVGIVAIVKMQTEKKTKEELKASNNTVTTRDITSK